MQIGPTNAADASVHHLSWNMFITHCSGPKISVRTRHPHWVMNLFAARVASFQIEGIDTSFAPLFPSIHPSSPPSARPSHLYASVLYFSVEKY